MEDLSDMIYKPFGGRIGVLSVTSQAGGNVATDTASASMTATGYGDYTPEELDIDTNDSSVGRPPFNSSQAHARTTTGKVRGG